jgi:phosphoribosylformylglycinamidine synthase
MGARLLLESFENAVDRERISHAWSLFGETQGRYIVTEAHSQHLVQKLAGDSGIGCCPIGWTGGETVALDTQSTRSVHEVALTDLRAAHEGFFPKLMGADAALA